MNCQVTNCRYKKMHITSRHCCGNCKMFGHGIMECGNQDMIKKLEQYNNMRISNKCTINGCIDSHTHITEGHSCRYCNSRLPTIMDLGNSRLPTIMDLGNSRLPTIIENTQSIHMKLCPNNGIKICDDITDFSNYIVSMVTKENNLKNGEYLSKYAGMGCMWYIRKNNNKDEYFFLHSDNMGQYGADTSDIPRLNAFIYEYKLN